MAINVVEKNLSQIKEKIVPYKPRIIAVTKYYDVRAMEEAYGAGLRDFGEARINDAIQKIELLSEEIRENSNFHFIGHLQTNKVDKVVKYFDYIQSVDSLHLAEAVSKSANKQAKVQKILLQVNISGEVQKFGFEERELIEEFEKIRDLENLKIEGLMCMAPLDAEENVLDDVFSKARNLRDLLNNKFDMNMTEVSMGMSNDYVYAVRNGSTMIRIGRLLFNL
ncbi:YggS family pyridoxal phosphate-dependent enzyme [bacterium]|nr:YggS family pyridoxal phosphate-dependent enzyme [bacterium]